MLVVVLLLGQQISYELALHCILDKLLFGNVTVTVPVDGGSTSSKLEVKLVLLLPPDIRDTGGQQVLVLLDPRQPEEALAVELQTKVCKDFIIAEKAPGAFTFRTLLRHYAKQTLSPW